jgi:hypothetical protein
MLPLDMIPHVIDAALKNPTPWRRTRGVPRGRMASVIMSLAVFSIGRPVGATPDPASVRLRVGLVVLPGVASPLVAGVGASGLGTCPCTIRILDGLRGGRERGAWLQRIGGLRDLDTNGNGRVCVHGRGGLWDLPTG